ncbi:MAG: hypothetical protein F6J90_09490 [Moorea sp. SIOASIH]|uniref:hypothetical protein n=1 Tax=Moorena sp. SIOASIH TaxID=2607817 RepID=UPI0013BD4F80|nr:hypothetical protein [Moorena sp. SIOASIH]NEO36541.1 hypothetical protein [Moorena sp. SIOASIH]
MNSQAAYFKRNKGFIQTSTLVLLAFSTTFFPRLLGLVGVPSLINFFHFAAVPFVCGVALVKSRTKNRKQIAIVQEIVFGLWLLLIVGFASALWNGAGTINVILGYLLLAEPFMMLLAIISLPLSAARFQWFQSWMTGFVIFHLFLIYIQKFVLNYCDLPGDCDNVQGVFYRSGSGHVVGASISCTFAVYYLVSAKSQPIWLRVLVFVAGFGNILTSDAKQVLLMFLVGFVILAFTNIKDIGKTLLYIIGTVIFIIVFTWAVQNVQAFSAFATWARPSIYGPEGEATLLKFSGIRIILTYHHSPWNWVFGLGPGHTIGRLGGWMIRDYSALLSPLGSTSVPVGETIPVSQAVWQYVASSWLAEGSSMFSPFWGWAGIWGDFGFLGVGAYLYLCSIVWRRVCLDEMPKLLMLSVCVCGFIFTQMEEPAYMLYIATVIGLRWQQLRLKVGN